MPIEISVNTSQTMPSTRRGLFRACSHYSKGFHDERKTEESQKQDIELLKS